MGRLENRRRIDQVNEHSKGNGSPCSKPEILSDGAVDIQKSGDEGDYSPGRSRKDDAKYELLVKCRLGDENGQQENEHQEGNAAGKARDFLPVLQQKFRHK